MASEYRAEITLDVGNELNAVFTPEEAAMCESFVEFATDQGFNGSYRLQHQNLRGYPIGILATLPEPVPVDFEFTAMPRPGVVPPAAVMLCEDERIWYESESPLGIRTLREFTRGVVTQHNRIPHPIGSGIESLSGDFDETGGGYYDIVSTHESINLIVPGYKFIPTDLGRVLTVASARMQGLRQEQVAIDELDSLVASPILDTELDKRIRTSSHMLTTEEVAKEKEAMEAVRQQAAARHRQGRRKAFDGPQEGSLAWLNGGMEERIVMEETGIRRSLEIARKAQAEARASKGS